ncbi:hypothetical protein ACKWTF_014689 [Chironomus riparius]
MRMSSFLCLELETGGKIVAWLGMVRYGLCMAILSIPILIGFLIPCEFINDKFDNYGMNHEFLKVCYVSKTLIIMAFVSIVTFFSGMFYVYYALYEGIKHKCARQIIPSIIFELTTLSLTILSFIFCESVYSFAGVAINVIINSFLVWTLVSIHQNLKNGVPDCGPVYFTQK